MTAVLGLSTDEARRLLARDGPNVLPRVRPVPRWRRIAAEFIHFFALMLWAAAALAFVAGMPELGIAILVVVVVNGVFSYVQEERAEHAAAKLRAMLPSQVLVLRDGRSIRTEAADLVCGDVVLLGAGDRVPADVEFTRADSCTVDESMLSGESEPVSKAPGDSGFGGTFLVNGAAKAVVRATGGRTRIAAIASLTTTVESPQSPLNNELRRIVRIIATVALGLGGVFFAASLLAGTSWRNAFLFAIGVCVALIPEGLLPTVTLSLAMGAQRMARRNALVRHLQAVETLGSTTFICTDKTGTLTQNRMNAVEVWTPDGMVKVEGNGYAPTAEVAGSPAAVERARRLGWAARAASSGRLVLREGEWGAEGDPMEAALDALAHRLAGPQGPAAAEVDVRWGFDSVRRRESVIVGSELLLKGAPENVLPLCGADTDRDAATRALESMASRGLRVLAVAARTLPGPTPGERRQWPASPEQFETHLALLGLVGLHDPPRPNIAAALETARRAGIKIAMVTGDHPSTAAAIAREIGLLGPERTVLEGRDLPEDDHVLGAVLDHDGVVISRVSPEQKLRVARAPAARTCLGHDRRRSQRRARPAGGGHRGGHGRSAAPTSPARPPTWSCWTTTLPPSLSPSNRAGPPIPTSVASSPTT